MPLFIFQRHHLRSTSWIICGSGSFAVQFWDHIRSGDHLRLGIICGAVQLISISKRESLEIRRFSENNLFSPVLVSLRAANSSKQHQFRKPSMNRLNLDQELACLGPCDMILVAKDGKQFQVHRNVPLQASPFFEKLLSSDMKENNEGVIRLPTVTDSQMADILKFIYNGSVQFTSEENAKKLIETAGFLRFSNLKSTMAGKFLEQHH